MTEGSSPRRTLREGAATTVAAMALAALLVALLAIGTGPVGEVSEVLAATDPGSGQFLVMQALACLVAGVTLQDVGF